MKLTSEQRERLEAARAQIQQKLAAHDTAQDALAKLEAKIEEVASEIARLERTVDPLDDGQVLTLTTKKNQLALLRSRTAPAKRLIDEAREAAEFAVRWREQDILMEVWQREYRARLDGIVAAFRPFYTDDTTARIAATNTPAAQRVMLRQSSGNYSLEVARRLVDDITALLDGGRTSWAFDPRIAA